MPTTLSQQATRSIDPDFVAQVGAAIDRDVPDMLSLAGAGFWNGIVTAIAPPAQADARSALRSFCLQCIEDRARVVAKIARLVAGEGGIIAVDITPATVGPPAVPAVFANASDTLIVNRTRVIIRLLTGV